MLIQKSDMDLILAWAESYLAPMDRLRFRASHNLLGCVVKRYSSADGYLDCHVVCSEVTVTKPLPSDTGITIDTIDGGLLSVGEKSLGLAALSAAGQTSGTSRTIGSPS